MEEESGRGKDINEKTPIHSVFKKGGQARVCKKNTLYNRSPTPKEGGGMIRKNIMESITTIRGFGPNEVWVRFESKFVSREEFEQFVKVAETSPALLEACESWRELWDMRPMDAGEDIKRILRACWIKTEAAIDKATE